MEIILICVIVDGEQQLAFADKDSVRLSPATSQDIGNNSSFPALVNVASVDQVYQKAIEFIQLTDQIRSAPDRMHNLHTQLVDACAELRSSVDSLQLQANELKGLTNTVSSVS